MSLLNQVFKEVEKNASEHDQLICEKILRELETIYQIPFVGFEDRTNVSMILSFFKLYGNMNFRDMVYALMEKNHLNKRSFLFRLTSEIYPPDFFDESRVLTNCLNLERKSDHYHLKTSFGTLKLYRLTDKILDQNIRYILQREDMHQKCHAVVAMFAPYFPNAIITTSKLNMLFGGKQYHSYMVSEDGSGVMDFSRNTFFSGNCFNEVFDPEVVIQYKASELEERFREFCIRNPELVNEFYPVLQLALKEEVEKSGKSI